VRNVAAQAGALIAEPRTKERPMVRTMVLSWLRGIIGESKLSRRGTRGSDSMQQQLAACRAKNAEEHWRLRVW
jgi:hypothetical protein